MLHRRLIPEEWVVLAGLCLFLVACRPIADNRDVLEIFAPLAREPLPISSNAVNQENITELQESANFLVSVGPVKAGAFSPVDRHIALQGADQVVRVWDVDTGRLLEEPFDHTGTGEAIAYSPDGSRLVSGGRSSGEDIVLLDAANWDILSLTGTAGFYVSDVAWSPDGSRYAMVSRGSGRIYIFTGDGERLTQRRPSGQWMWAVAYGDRWMAGTNELGATYVFTTMDYDFRREMWYAPRAAGRDLELSPDESILANCHIDGVVQIYELGGDWDLIVSFEAHEYKEPVLDGCRDAAFTASGDILFTGGDDGYLRGWDPLTGNLLFEKDYGSAVWTVDVSTDGELVAAALGDGTLHLLNIGGQNLAATTGSDEE